MRIGKNMCGHPGFVVVGSHLRKSITCTLVILLKYCYDNSSIASLHGLKCYCSFDAHFMETFLVKENDLGLIECSLMVPSAV